MFSNMPSGKPRIETRGYIRAIPGLPISRQREMAQDAGCHHIYEWGEVKGQDVRGAWLRSLREGDTAWLPSIMCLVIPPDSRPERYRPTPDLAAVLAELCARRVEIVDAKAGCSTRDPRAWANHVRLSMERASQGERSRRALLRSIKRANAERAPGVVTRWLAEGKAKDRRQALLIWTSSTFTSDTEAAAALPDELKVLSGSTLRRILGPRRPNDPSAGGRGKTRKRKTR